MRILNKRHTLCLLIAAGGCVAGAYSAYAAFSNGKVIAGGLPGIIFGLAFAAVVVVSWLMLPWADRRAEEGAHRDAWLWRVSWLLALGFVLANSVVYCVHYRTEMTETKGLQIEAYERAQRLEALASAELAELRKNYRWELTAGCSNATAAKSIQYCEHVREAQARMQSADAILSQGRPGAKDAGADTLAWVLGVGEEKVRRSLPIFWAVILELMASLCMREAFATLRVHSGPGETGTRAAVPEAPSATMPLRVPVLVPAAQSSPLGIHAAWHLAGLQRRPMNDNMPLAAYA